MRKIIIIWIVFLFFSLINLNLIYAENILNVEKLVENPDINTNDDVVILLKFYNPFEEEIPIKIIDKNVFANNGINIECLEINLPSDKESVIAYEPIKAYSSGQFTLDSAEIQYTNPQTKKQETIKSNELKISIKESGKSYNQQNNAQGITSIYRCNGINKQSTSYSSYGSSSFNMQIGGESNTQQQTSQSKVQNNQMNQNANAIKQQMEKDIQEKKQTEEEFQKNLEKTSEFQEKNKALLNQNYNLTNSSFSALTNNTGSFEMSYKKNNGQTATLSGKIENGTMKKIISFTSQDKQKIMEMLEENKKFQSYNNDLINKGLNRTEPVFNLISQNNTQVTISYKNNETESKIKADYINNTIKNVKLEKAENKSENNKKNLLWLLPLTLLIIVLAWNFYKKNRKRKNEKEKAENNKKAEKIQIDYRKESKKMLKRAKKLFFDNKKKDAYEIVAYVIRFYFSHKFDTKKEITNTELLKYLKKKKISNYNKIQKCLDICCLVEFAKYSPNAKDFNEIINIAEKAII
ncbi:MAG: hypothetical protein B6U87_03065 [Candidatus Aenigmarchaeota archaeon ex4484_52]|nr:MAG: hypothetical protein B6U87_03065 [Candidatus Aenigmarchaeota archaeon ex4484_52]